MILKTQISVSSSITARIICNPVGPGANESDVTVVTANSVTSPGPRFEWYPLCVRDEAFFHAVISSTSSHAAYLQQVNLPFSFFRHRGQAIRLLNQRIAREAHDEGTINTIAVFSLQEVPHRFSAIGYTWG